MSTSPTMPAQGVAPGIPSVTQALPNLRQDFMVIIPDIPHADPEPPVQVVSIFFPPMLLSSSI